VVVVVIVAVVVSTLANRHSGCGRHALSPCSVPGVCRADDAAPARRGCAPDGGGNARVPRGAGPAQAGYEGAGRGHNEECGRYAARRADIDGEYRSLADARRQLLPTLPSDRYRAEVAEVVNLRLRGAMAGVPAGAVAAAEVSSTITRKASPPETYGFHGGFAYAITVWVRPCAADLWPHHLGHTFCIRDLRALRNIRPMLEAMLA